MRQIKFRGLRTDGKGWVYGYLILRECESPVPETTESYKEYLICTYDFNGLEEFQVLPESVGQYIETINNQDVFDGDIFCITDSKYSYYVKIEDGLQAICYHIMKKDWDDKSHLRWGSLYRIKLRWDNQFYITGNIHQNPELCQKP